MAYQLEHRDVGGFEKMLDGVLTSLARCVHARSLRPILWVLGVASVCVTLARAIDLATATPQVDVDVYLMGAKQVFTGHLYTTYLAFPREAFTYPPAAALLFLPFTLVSRVTGQVIWAVISTILYIGFLVCSLRSTRPDWQRSELVLWSFILALPVMVLNPIAMNFDLGQINVLLALLVLADLTGRYALKGQTIPRGIMTGLAAAIKVTPFIFVPFLFATRQFRAGCVALTTFLVCGLVMLIVAPSEAWSYWTKYIFDAHRVGGVVYVSNQSLRSTIFRFSHGHAPEGLIVVLILLAGIVGLSAAVWAYRSSSALLGILLCAVTGLIVSPITWAHHLVWIVPIVLWLALAHDRPAFGRVWAALALIWFWYGPIWRTPHGKHLEFSDSLTQSILGNSYTIAMMLFVGGMVIMLALRHRRNRDRYRGGGWLRRETSSPSLSLSLPLDKGT